MAEWDIDTLVRIQQSLNATYGQPEDDEPCLCGTDFTCLAHDHDEERLTEGHP